VVQVCGDVLVGLSSRVPALPVLHRSNVVIRDWPFKRDFADLVCLAHLNGGTGRIQS
jgi:hypothetical protein